MLRYFLNPKTAEETWEITTVEFSLIHLIFLPFMFIAALSKLVSSVEVHINITDVNDNPPRFEKISYSASVMELQPVGTSVIQVCQTFDLFQDEFIVI